MKRRQANEWAACVSPEKKGIPVLKGFSAWKAALPEAIGRAEGRPAGWVASGTVKEDGPVTWETPVCPRRKRGCGNVAMGVGLRPGGKRPDEPPNPTAMRAATGCRGKASDGSRIEARRETAG